MVFNAVFERLDELRAVAILSKERHSAWPALRNFFSSTNQSPTP
jgi:hypothetical protein